MKKKIVIFGGSFNPPHIGHKKIIEIVRDSFECDEIWLMPSGNRTDKTMHTTNDHRLNLAHLLAENLKRNRVSTVDKTTPEISVSTIEINRSIPTTTIDTLRELELSHPDFDFYFMISSELVPDIRTFWDEGEELFKNTKFIIIERTGSHTLDSLELPPFSTTIPVGVNTVPEISSTILRALDDAENLEKWTDKELADYIIQNKIYGFKQEN